MIFLNNLILHFSAWLSFDVIFNRNVSLNIITITTQNSKMFNWNFKISMKVKWSSKAIKFKTNFHIDKITIVSSPQNISLIWDFDIDKIFNFQSRPNNFRKGQTIAHSTLNKFQFSFDLIFNWFTVSETSNFGRSSNNNKNPS